MSVCVSAMVAAINAVPAPIQAMTCRVSGAVEKKKLSRAVM